MKKTLALLLALCMAFAVFGCAAQTAEPAVEEETATQPEAAVVDAAAEAPAEDVTITYCNFNASGGQEETLQAMYDAFHEQYPNITVEIETIGYSDYFTQMQTRVAGGTAPDCYELNIENFAAYSAKGVLAEITGVNTSGINETALSAFNVDGVQYGLPGCFSNVVLIYNKDLFDQAGVDYPTNDWTWDDAQVAAEAIRALGDDYFGIFAPITYNEFYKVAAQFGGSIFNEDKTAFTVNSAECVAAAKMMVERVTVSNVQPTTEQQGGMGDWDWFMSGKLGMIPTGIWAFNTFAESCDFSWDIVVEPGMTQKATHFFSNAYVVNAESENAQAAMTWINFLASSPEAAQLRIDAGWDLPAITDESVLATYLDLGLPANRQAVFDSLDYLTIPPVIEENSLMSDIITSHLEEAASGAVTVEQAMDDCQAELEASIQLG
jgi:multiple sugar transport system substrate-binding protein